MTRFIVLLIIVLGACAPPLPNPASITPATAQPTPNATAIQELCSTAQLRARDWQSSIEALRQLQRLGAACGSNETLDAQLYSAYLGYGTELEQLGAIPQAIRAYEDALSYDPNGSSAQRRLEVLQALTETPAPLRTCPPAVAEQYQDGLLNYQPTNGSFAVLGAETFRLDGQPYPIYGVNYYPSRTPFSLFLREPSETIDEELTLIRGAGINTLRIFLYYETLFACPGNGVIPIAEHLQRLDALIHAAAAHDLRLIVVLHQNPDLTDHPLYENPAHIRAQTQFLVERYRDEPVILAWDIRDRGDQDYLQGTFERRQVLRWLADTIVLVRTLDANHPITAGWWQDALVTAPLVDFVSFQAYGEYSELRQDIANYRASAGKPILLSAVGYSTFQLDETVQRNLLYQALEEVQQNDLLGWVVFMAFDYPRTTTCIPPNCPGSGRTIDHYGLWNTSYFPKLSVEAVEVITRVRDE